MKRCLPPFTLILCAMILMAAAQATAADEPAPETSAAVQPTPQPLGPWLLLGPWPSPLPAFHAADEQGFALKDLLKERTLDPQTLRPKEGTSLPAPGGPVTWHEVSISGEGLDLTPPGADPAEAWLAIYLDADRWQEVTLRLRSTHQAEAFLDGKSVDLAEEKRDAETSLETGDVAPEAPPTAPVPWQKGTLPLIIGKHLLLVHAVYDPAKEAPWQVAGSIARGADLPPEALAFSIDPTRAVDIHDILDAPRIDDVALSPDGELAAISLSEYVEGAKENWLEIRRLKDGSLADSWRGGLEASRIQWHPDSHRLSYTSSNEDKTTVWLHDLRSGTTEALLRGVEKFGRYEWAPDGSFLVYSFTVEPKPDERKVKRVQNPADRQPWWRNHTFLVEVAVPEGPQRRLTAGPLSAENWQISPDGTRLLFFLSEPDLLERPYSTSELWELDLASLEATRILDDRWISGAAYGPEDANLALTGSPSAFGGLGRNLPENVQANDYGGQLYLYDRMAGTARAVSREFTPDIADIHWSLVDGRIYALCTDTQYRRLYAYDPGKNSWSRVPAGVDYVDEIAYARAARAAVVAGTSITTPHRAMALDLRKDRALLLHDPGTTHYRDIDFGPTEMWSCRLPDGETMDGRIYYPRGFDPAKTYPVIVYYYGGTSPVTVDYGGRYPKNVWAGEGYAIYVPEPSGAIGYGQAFAARHVNDWGKRTAGEVIEGTKAFLAAHSWADPERVGCIGASYGGFLTEYLITQTDMFKAAVSHAGISSIASYWGEGYWGYAYGARALAGTFPWSDRELYIEQSPLFLADRIHTPLLLVHGGSDTNVPVGESIQLFTALKLLDRPVEFVRIEGQNHWIIDHDQRIVWNDTILAFFAWHLKDQPQWWQALYPETKPKDAEKSEK
jgi:dipeptidyl aminopeptidase/acylaminoacyl peptidase